MRTAIDDRIARLEEELKRTMNKVKEMEAKYAMLQNEMAKMKCLFTSVKVPVEPLKPSEHGPPKYM